MISTILTGQWRTIDFTALSSLSDTSWDVITESKGVTPSGLELTRRPTPPCINVDKRPSHISTYMLPMHCDLSNTVLYKQNWKGCLSI